MKKYICVFLFCLFPFTSYSGELLEFSENYISEFTENFDEIKTADMAWKEGSLEKAWDIYSSISEVTEHPLFQSVIFLKKALIAHELGMEKEVKENILAFIKPFIIEAEVEIDADNLEIVEETIINSIIQNAEKFKELFFAVYENSSDKK